MFKRIILFIDIKMFIWMFLIGIKMLLLLKIGINVFMFPFNWYQDALLWHIFFGILIDCHPLFTSFLFLDKKGENIAFIVFNPFVDSLVRTKRGRRIYWFIFTLTLCWWLTKRGRIIWVYMHVFICMFCLSRNIVCFYLLVCRLIGIKSIFCLFVDIKSII